MGCGHIKNSRIDLYTGLGSRVLAGGIYNYHTQWSLYMDDIFVFVYDVCTFNGLCLCISCLHITCVVFGLGSL